MSINSNHNNLSVAVHGGHFVATVCENEDLEYPGICVEYVADNDNGNTASRPKVQIEYPLHDAPRVLIWQNSDSEDYTEDIPLMSQRQSFELSYIDHLSQLQNDIDSDNMPTEIQEEARRHVTRLMQLLEEYSA